MTNYIVLDTETTGLDAKIERLVELACINLDTSSILFSSRFNPCKEVGQGAYQVHGLSLEDLKNCSRFKERKGEILEVINNSTLLIHNAGFDLKFLHREFILTGDTLQKVFKRLNVKVICTLALARKVKATYKNDLDTLKYHFGINMFRGNHSADKDCLILAEVYKNLIVHPNFNESFLKSSMYNIEQIKLYN